MKKKTVSKNQLDKPVDATSSEAPIEFTSEEQIDCNEKTFVQFDFYNVILIQEDIEKANELGKAKSEHILLENLALETFPLGPDQLRNLRIYNIALLQEPIWGYFSHKVHFNKIYSLILLATKDLNTALDYARLSIMILGPIVGYKELRSAVKKGLDPSRVIEYTDHLERSPPNVGLPSVANFLAVDWKAPNLELKKQEFLKLYLYYGWNTDYANETEQSLKDYIIEKLLVVSKRDEQFVLHTELDSLYMLFKQNDVSNVNALHYARLSALLLPSIVVMKELRSLRKSGLNINEILDLANVLETEHPNLRTIAKFLGVNISFEDNYYFYMLPLSEDYGRYFHEHKLGSINEWERAYLLELTKTHFITLMGWGGELTVGRNAFRQLLDILMQSQCHNYEIWDILDHFRCVLITTELQEFLYGEFSNHLDDPTEISKLYDFIKINNISDVQDTSLNEIDHYIKINKFGEYLGILDKNLFILEHPWDIDSDCWAAMQYFGDEDRVKHLWQPYLHKLQVIKKIDSIYPNSGALFVATKILAQTTITEIKGKKVVIEKNEILYNQVHWDDDLNWLMLEILSCSELWFFGQMLNHKVEDGFQQPQSNDSAEINSSHKICYLFFDTETNGKALDFNSPVEDLDNWPRIAQLGWQLYNTNQELINEGSYLIKPDGWEIPKEQFFIENNMSTERCEELGIPISEALDLFLADLSQSKTLVAHNLAFDINVIGAELIRAKKSMPEDIIQICTMKASTDFCAIKTRWGFKWPTLTELHMKLFNEGFEGAHDALDDVKACAKSFFELQKIGIINK